MKIRIARVNFPLVSGSSATEGLPSLPIKMPSLYCCSDKAKFECGEFVSNEDIGKELRNLLKAKLSGISQVNKFEFRWAEGGFAVAVFFKPFNEEATLVDRLNKMLDLVAKVEVCLANDTKFKKFWRW